MNSEQTLPRAHFTKEGQCEMKPSQSAGKNLLSDERVRRSSSGLLVKAESSMSRNMGRDLKRKPATDGAYLS